MHDQPWPSEELMSGLSLLAGGANVIMQLALAPVGRGVLESTVVSGSLHHHPIKRTRTTLGYVMISLFGTEHERAVLRSEVNRQHRAVRSSPESPVTYDAFDPALQLWVAACMYRGVVDTTAVLYGEVSDAMADTIYQACSCFVTTLQVPQPMWPANRDDFERYWDASLERVAMDDATRAFLYGVASLDFVVAPLRWLFSRPYRFVTAGFLPERFRDEVGLSWGPRRQRMFDALMRSLAILNARLPVRVRAFPWNVALYDARRRIARGRAFV